MIGPTNFGVDERPGVMAYDRDPFAISDETRGPDSGRPAKCPLDNPRSRRGRAIMGTHTASLLFSAAPAWHFAVAIKYSPVPRPSRPHPSSFSLCHSSASAHRSSSWPRQLRGDHLVAPPLRCDIQRCLVIGVIPVSLNVWFLIYLCRFFPLAFSASN